jgi:hypothetical protein
MSDPLFDVDGNYTGLLVPSQRPMAFAPYRASQQVLSKDQVRQIVESKDRTPAAERYPVAWRKNQGRRGSCAGYAGKLALECARYNAGLPHVSLSGEFLYALCNGGRDAGSELLCGMQKMQSVGICKEELVPHEEYRLSKITPAAKADAENQKGFECYRVDDESELASGLALGFVGVVALEASRNWNRVDSNGVSGYSQGKGNHAVCCWDVRVKSGKFQFQICNSWGLKFGQQGTAWQVWDNHFALPIKYHAFYLIRAALGGDVPEIKQ